jgi:hypothetical protein
MFDVMEEDKQEMFQFLDELRESGEVNMFGAAPYLQEAFLIDRREARKVLTEWMETFEERHNAL